VILVDTNVLIDIATEDPIWAEWSLREFNAAAAIDELAINDVVYAELSVGYASVDELDRAIQRVGITLAPIPRTALFIAGRVFQRYRAAGGIRTGVLPDFFLGAHAAVAGIPLLTRDTRRYRTYFPELTLIAPIHN
jgi:predicted nucleic acid-binding protein